jgi:hypothetical protein
VFWAVSNPVLRAFRIHPGLDAARLDEAWVIISQEDAQATNLDINALRADINALHGTGGS